LSIAFDGRLTAEPNAGHRIMTGKAFTFTKAVARMVFVVLFGLSSAITTATTMNGKIKRNNSSYWICDLRTIPFFEILVNADLASGRFANCPDSKSETT
jgi:hypothetical protein